MGMGILGAGEEVTLPSRWQAWIAGGGWRIEQNPRLLGLDGVSRSHRLIEAIVD